MLGEHDATTTFCKHLRCLTRYMHTIPTYNYGLLGGNVPCIIEGATGDWRGLQCYRPAYIEAEPCSRIIIQYICIIPGVDAKQPIKARNVPVCHRRSRRNDRSCSVAVVFFVGGAMQLGAGV